MELTKLLTSAHPEKISMVEDTGISPYVTRDFPLVFQTERERMAGGISRPEPFSCLALLPPEKSMRWAGFLRHMEPDMVRRILKGLKLDNETVDNGKVMAGAAQAPLGPEKPGIRRFLSRMTPYQFDGCLRLKALDKDPQTEEVRRLWGGDRKRRGLRILKGAGCGRRRPAGSRYGGKGDRRDPQASAGTGAGGPVLKPEGASAGKAPGLSGKVCVSGLEGSQKKFHL